MNECAKPVDVKEINERYLYYIYKRYTISVFRLCIVIMPAIANRRCNITFDSNIYSHSQRYS